MNYDNLKNAILNKQKKEIKNLLQILPEDKIVNLTPKQYAIAEKIAKGRFESNRKNNVYHPNLDGKEINHLSEPWKERDLIGSLGEIIALNWIHENFPELNSIQSINQMLDFTPRSCRKGSDDGDITITLKGGRKLNIDVKCTNYGKPTSIPEWKSSDKNIHIILRVSIIDLDNGIGYIEGFIKAEKTYDRKFWNTHCYTPCWSIPSSELDKNFISFLNKNF